MLIPSARISLQPIVIALLLIQLIMIILGDFFLFPMAASNEYIAKGEWWRLMTSLLVHVDLQHFLSNSICLFVLGSSIEKQLGHFFFPHYFSFLAFSEIFPLTLLCLMNTFMPGHLVVFSDC